MNPKPAVLIISDRWGSPFQGGIPAAVRLLARLFNSLGFVIYCTVLKVTEEEYKDAEELNVTLVPPKLRGSLEWEEKDKPHRKWLLSHESYFENLKNLAKRANIKIVVGFALATSEASLNIKDNVFVTAKYYITNLWPCDNLPPSILGCSEEVLSKLVKILQKIHHKEADAVTSIDHQTFKSFFQNLKRDTHFQILPTPEEKYFSSNPLNHSPEITGKQLLSFLEEHDERKISTHINLTKAINSAAENYHAVYKEQLKWVIHGVQSATEDDIINVLKPFRHLKIVPRPMFSSWSIENDLLCSHLVLIPPESPGINSLHLLISTLAAGIPLLVALFSPSHDFIKEYFPDYVDDMIVDMTTPEVLAEKILHIFNNYQCSLKKAAEIKEKFKTKTVTLIDDINRRFIAHVKADPHIKGLLPPADNGNLGSSTESADGTGPENNMGKKTSSGTKGQMTICVTPTVIPEEYQPVAHLIEEYNNLPEVVKGTPKRINGLYPGINVEDIRKGCIIYHVKCTTLDALNYLWHYYTSQKLHKLITSTTVTKKTLAIIGAVYLELQVTMDIEEYRQCKLELTQKGVHKLLLLGMDRSLKPTVGDLISLLNVENSIRQRGQQFDILQAVMTMTDTVEHILSCRQDVLALLGVTRYLLTDAPTQDLTLITSEGIEEQLIQNGTQVLPLTGTDENCSSLVQSLLSPETTITKVTHYWVEHLLKLGSTQLDAEKTILLKQPHVRDGEQEKAGSEEILKDPGKAFEPEFKKVTKSFSGHTTEGAGKVVPQSELDTVKKLLLDEQREARKERAILEEHVLKVELELEEKRKMIFELTEISDKLSLAERERAILKEQVRIQALELKKKEKMIQEVSEQSELEALVLNWKFPEYKVEDAAAALIITPWKKSSYGPTNWKLISDFCENTLKKKPAELSAIYCTVLDVDVGEEEKEDAARHSITLIPATRPKGSDPVEDPPAINWLLFHQSYYPELGKLENINHVVALSPNIKWTAAALQESVFPDARFHPPPDQPAAAVFINEAWSKDALGLTGFHRTLVQDFCERKAKAGEAVKAYSTVLDVKISDEQKEDAEICGVTLIPAQRKEKADHTDDPPNLEWLLNHEIYYPDLGEVENVQYVIGYAPKTGRAAADIRRKLFPCAKLVLINHARPETNCLQAEEYGQVEFEEKMLQMASEADYLFSIGPYIYDYFENAYRAEVQGRDLSEIPHVEILPRPNTCFWVKKPKEKPVTQHHILTCGQMDTQNAIEGCKPIAASIGSAANCLIENYRRYPEWKIQGVSEKAGKIEQMMLADASESPYVYPKLQPGHSVKSLLTSLKQSHLCLPSPCYWDYSFYGLEAMAFGLPTSVNEDSHLAHFVMKHLKLCADYCVITNYEVNLSKKISEHLEKTPDSFKKANALKTALTKCEAITESFAKFASLLKGPVRKESEDDCKDQEVAKYSTVLPVKVALDEEMLQKRLRELEEQAKTVSVQLQRQQEKEKE